MNVYLALVRRELGGAFNSLTGFVVVAVVLLLTGYSLTDIIGKLNGGADDRPVVEMFYQSAYFWLILLPVTPVITMRSFAAEKAPTTADGGGQALFRVDQKRVVWLEAGKSIEPGVVLAAIEPNGVRLLQNGQEVRLPLREPRAAAAPGNSLPPAAKAVAAIASVPVKAPAAASPASCRLTQEQRTRAYVLRPEIIDTVMRERAGWTELFKPTAEGVMVQNPGGTGAMLGLYGNDLLVHANGARLGGAEDVLRLVMQPLARNESVIVTGSRSGQPREWIYSGMNCAQR